MMDCRQTELEHDVGIVPRRDPVLISGSGAKVTDDSGRHFIDCVGGHGVASLGHAHPAVVQAVSSQAQQIVACSSGFFNPVRAQLLSLLSEIAPGNLSRSFLCNSGTEAVEAALKFARLATGRADVVCARRAFHGRTFGSLSATFNPRYRRGVGPLVPGFEFITYNDAAQLRAAVSDHTAAVLLEPVQGEGGVHVGDPAFLRLARDLCDQHGALFVLDEVQTGCCRTGRWFACEYSGVVPDILCIAKGMANGVPIGATICREDLDLPLGSHGSTFGGNPLACAAAHATIEVMRHQEFAQKVADKGRRLLDRLTRIDSPQIRDVRGVGLMVGVDLRSAVRPVVDGLEEEGVLALPAGRTVLRFLPPLTIEEHLLDEVADAVARVLR